MEQKTKKKIIQICAVIVILVSLLFAVGFLMLRYQVEGETNLPFDISKISIMSSIDTTSNEDKQNIWNLNVNQINDIYIDIEKNKDYKKTEIIKSIKLDNFNISTKGSKGQMHIYKPTEKDVAIFKAEKENIVNEVTYKGDVKSDIKKLKVSNQGGRIAVRISNDGVSTYISKDAKEVDYSKLLQVTNVNIDDLRADINFDITIKLKSKKSYKANISLNIPEDSIIEKGTCNKEITDLKDVVFKRIENN